MREPLHQRHPVSRGRRSRSGHGQGDADNTITTRADTWLVDVEQPSLDGSATDPVTGDCRPPSAVWVYACVGLANFASGTALNLALRDDEPPVMTSARSTRRARADATTPRGCAWLSRRDPGGLA